MLYTLSLCTVQLVHCVFGCTVHIWMFLDALFVWLLAVFGFWLLTFRKKKGHVVHDQRSTNIKCEIQIQPERGNTNTVRKRGTRRRRLEGAGAQMEHGNKRHHIVTEEHQKNPQSVKIQRRNEFGLSNSFCLLFSLILLPIFAPFPSLRRPLKSKQGVTGLLPPSAIVLKLPNICELPHVQTPEKFAHNFPPRLGSKSSYLSPSCRLCIHIFTVSCTVVHSCDLKISSWVKEQC